MGVNPINENLCLFDGADGSLLQAGDRNLDEDV